MTSNNIPCGIALEPCSQCYLTLFVRWTSLLYHILIIRAHSLGPPISPPWEVEHSEPVRHWSCSLNTTQRLPSSKWRCCQLLCDSSSENIFKNDKHLVERSYKEYLHLLPGSGVFRYSGPANTTCPSAFNVLQYRSSFKRSFRHDVITIISHYDMRCKCDTHRHILDTVPLSVALCDATCLCSLMRSVKLTTKS